MGPSGYGGWCRAQNFHAPSDAPPSQNLDEFTNRKLLRTSLLEFLLSFHSLGTDDDITSH